MPSRPKTHAVGSGMAEMASICVLPLKTSIRAWCSREMESTPTGVAVLERALFLGLALKDFVVAIGVERRAFAATEWLRPRRRVYLAEVKAGVGQFLELFKIVAAVNDARVHEGGGFLARCSVGPVAREVGAQRRRHT